MNIEPEITDAPTTEALAGIPPTSPYYDRLRSLNYEMDFAPYGSPEFHMIDRQINELTERALKRMEAEKTLNMNYDK